MDYRQLFSEYNIKILPGIDDTDKKMLQQFVSKTNEDLNKQENNDILQEIMCVHKIIKVLYKQSQTNEDD